MDKHDAVLLRLSKSRIATLKSSMGQVALCVRVCVCVCVCTAEMIIIIIIIVHGCGCCYARWWWWLDLMRHVQNTSDPASPVLLNRTEIYKLGKILDRSRLGVLFFFRSRSRNIQRCRCMV